MLTESTLTAQVIGLAINVHRQLGPGLLESAYEACLCFELTQAGIEFRRQAAIPIVYSDMKLDEGYRADIIVAQALVVEIKSVETISPVHEAQIITYLRLGGYRVGLLLNFNMLRLKDGLRRFVLSDPARRAPVASGHPSATPLSK
jgi:GxxExxY protein